MPTFATPADAARASAIARFVLNPPPTNSAPIINLDGSTTTITTSIKSTVTIGLSTDRDNDASTLLNNRYQLLRNQLINSGVSSSNIIKGAISFGVKALSATLTGNLTTFTIRSTISQTSKTIMKCPTQIIPLRGF